ncbi:glucodextranase DOMON-like domain-containing protein [Kibdelosporangium phytohabitans]|uniref:Glucan 1,4-alpha-glucosidase n=1 Tax=Kibdelosporangium phytohabitans TaxID=860235 RepID=A0A0N9I9X8_9PSEU|nr:glucodextranase DOMON-like domain-containing protein [Kibdelosporangium phytohabitans]ALG13192.1 glucan 1,4-alpha-glucosidase [Kibdelosporangium phytohabitans]MBE1464955.1 glucan 1,4-alpha-glucosidase [Kibdelosporangium phytohabitans]
MRRFGVLLALTLGVMCVTPTAQAQTGPGALSHFGLARKDCVGTARNTTSKVWFTVADGVLSDVYAPTIDNTNVETLQFLVTDGRTFTDLQSRDMRYTVSSDRTGMACQVRSEARNYRLTTEFITDPARDSVLVRARLHGPANLRLFVRYDATMNGNGGGGPLNGGADTATADLDALVSGDTNTVTNAPNRDYGVPLFGALKADRPFKAANSGYVGTSSDGLVQLDKDRVIKPNPKAANGNVVQTAQLDGHEATLALGFGKSAAQAVDTAGQSVKTPWNRTYDRYVGQWRDYDRGLEPTDDPVSVNVLKASEDKTFSGTVVASLGSPWGHAVSAGDLPDGKPVYFGSYREIFARDLYESFTGLMAAGDRDTARATVTWLFSRQQQPDGRFPRNSMINGKKAPDSGGDQLDETAYPILMALQAGFDRDRDLYAKIRKAADFVVAHGPSFGSERWEEQSGYSPSTIAAQIAGLTAAGVIATRNGDQERARVYHATADHFQRSIKGWTVDRGHFIRLSKTGDPAAPIQYNLGNGSVTVDQRSVVDAGFLELPRLGILPADDPEVARSLELVDRTIKRQTPNGPGWYRYGTAAPGSEDGYGDCYEPDLTTCAPTGKPWPTGNVGSGHLWPVLAGERAEHLVQTGDRRGARQLLDAMHAQASGVGLIPEQIWENAPVPEAPYGSDPTTASIGFKPGESVGSASPLTWAQAQAVRLTQSIAAGRLVEQPAEVRARYVDNGPPSTIPISLQAPGQVSTPTVKVTGVAPRGTRIDISATATDAGGVTTVVTTYSDGTFTAELPALLGTNVITAAATQGSRKTGYAQVRVGSDFVSGTVLLNATDPDNDDNGPGTYAYPTAGDFNPGAFDIQQFQVIDSGDRVILRTKLRNLSPTFGSPLGAQLLTIYAHDPAVATTSTKAPYPSRNYAVDPWNRMIEVQGFAEPVFVDADGVPLGDASVQASETSRYITVSVPKSALGNPRAYAVVLTGQEGDSQDRARGFTATPEQYTFGVCAPGGTRPICSTGPSSVPKAVDVITPAGVDQSVELDPTRGPVVVKAVSSTP